MKTLHQIKNHKNFKQGIPELDPVGEMNIKTEEICVFFLGGAFWRGSLMMWMFFYLILIGHVFKYGTLEDIRYIYIYIYV